MRTGNVLFSAVHFFVVLAVMAFGGACVGIAKVPAVKMCLMYLISTQSEAFFSFGMAALGLSLVLLAGLYAMNRKRYLQVAMDSKHTAIDEALIGKYVSKYWQGVFPETGYAAKVLILPNQKIEVIAEAPVMDEEAHTALLERVEGELGSLFFKNLGYDKDFKFTVVFK